MATTLGKDAVIQISTNDSTYNSISCDSVSLDVGRDYADTSKFGDTGKRQMAGLRNFAGSISGKLDLADTGQAAIKTAIDAGNLVYIKCLPDGTNGYKSQCVLKGWKIDAKQGSEAATFSVDYEQAGGAAPTAIP